jgi:hypothetical protein
LSIAQFHKVLVIAPFEFNKDYWVKLPEDIWEILHKAQADLFLITDRIRNPNLETILKEQKKSELNFA